MELGQHWGECLELSVALPVLEAEVRYLLAPFIMNAAQCVVLKT